MFEVMLSFFARASGALASLALAIVVARIMPLAEAGSFHSTYALVLIIAGLSRWGLDNAVTRNASLVAVPQSKLAALEFLRGTARLVLSTSFISMFAVLLLVAALFIFAPALYLRFVVGDLLGFIAALLGTVPVTMAAFAGFFLLGRSKIFRGIFVAQGALPVFLIILITAVASFGNQPRHGYLMLITWASFLNLALAAIVFHPHRIKFRPVTKSDISASLVYGKPAVMSAIAYLLINWGPALILNVLSSAKDAAIFASANRISLVGTLVLAAMNSALSAPSAQLLQRGDHEGVLQLTRGMSSLVCIGAMPVIAVCCFFSSGIMNILYGADYTVGGEPLRLLLLAQLFNVMTGPSALILSMAGHERDVRNGYMAGLASFLLLGVSLMSRGAVGVAIAIATAQFSQNAYWAWRVNARVGGIIWPKISDIARINSLIKAS